MSFHPQQADLKCTTVSLESPDTTPKDVTGIFFAHGCSAQETVSGRSIQSGRPAKISTAGSNKPTEDIKRKRKELVWWAAAVPSGQSCMGNTLYDS